MAYFPFFIDIQDKHCLVVGGGQVAFRKVSVLLSFDVYVTVVAPVICQQLKELVKSEAKLLLVERDFDRSDLSQAFFVVAATNKPLVNEAIAVLCKQSNTLVNVADSMKNSNYIFPSIVKRGDVVIGTSTSGCSPDLAKWVRKNLESAIPDYVAELADRLGDYRGLIKERINSEAERKRAFKELLYVGMKHEGKLDDKMVEKVIKKYE